MLGFKKGLMPSPLSTQASMPSALISWPLPGKGEGRWELRTCLHTFNNPCLHLVSDKHFDIGEYVKPAHAGQDRGSCCWSGTAAACWAARLAQYCCQERPCWVRNRACSRRLRSIPLSEFVREAVLRLRTASGYTLSSLVRFKNCFFPKPLL